MKKIVASLIMLFTTASLAQSPGWTTLKETNISVGTNAYDIFTNGAGNHIIVQEANALKYYKMDVNGNTIINLNPPLESTAVTSPSISGDLTKLYVVYGKGTENKIRTKYSTDGGVSWSYILPDLNTSSAPSSIECVFSKGNLHVTFLVGTTVYFNYYNTTTTPPNWLTQSISVSETFSASNPRICVWNAGSNNLVYFTFNVGSSIKWKKYIVGGGMSSINNIIQSGGGLNIGIAVDATYIYSFQNEGPSNNVFAMYARRIVDNWYLGSGNFNNNTNVGNIFSTITANAQTYTAAWDKTNDPGPTYRISRMRFNGSTNLEEDLIYQDPSLTPVNIVNLSAAGNDVHVIWKDNLGTNSGNNLRYKYYDDYPIPPQNLTINKSINNHPLLSWINPNPDANTSNTYKIYRKNSCLGYWESEPIAQTTALSYEDVSQSYCTAIPPARCENMCNFEYKIKTLDLGLKESPYSDIVSVWLVGGPPQKAGVDEPSKNII